MNVGFTHLNFISFPVLLLFAIFSVAVNAQTINGKFTDRDGRTLLILGQDLGSVQGYVDSGFFPEIGGATMYTDVYDFAGLNSVTNYGAGDIGLQEAIDRWPNSVLSIGLWMVEDNDGVGQDHPNGLTELVNGVYDASLQRFADFCNRNDPHPIFLRIGYEFDGPWNAYDPGKYQNGYRYIKNFLDARGVTNVAYVWQSAAWGATGSNFTPWYPGDEYVDYVGLSFFFFDDNFNADELQALLDFARSKNKPIQMSEVSAQYHDFNEGRFHPFDSPGSPIAVSGQDAWNQYFRDQLLPFVRNNSDVIRQVAYINADWQSQDQWRWPDAGNGFWGDTRIEADPVIAQNWANEISDTSFWIHGGPSLFSSLGVDGATIGTPLPRPTRTPSGQTPDPTPTSVPTTPPLPGDNVLFEAESGTILGSASVFDDAAASGGAGIAFISSNGAGFSVSGVPAAGSFDIRYASELSGEISIRINGNNVGNVSFSSTGAWVGTYSTVTANFDVPANASVDVFFENGDSAMNVDHLEFESISNTSPTPAPTFVPTPNPSLRPSPIPESDWYFIVHKPTGSKIQSCATETLTPIGSRPNANRGDCVQWKRIENGAFFHIQNRISSTFMKPDTAEDGSPISVVPNTWRGNWTQWNFEARGDGFGHIVNRGTGKYIQLGGRPNADIAQQPSSWRGDFTRWRFDPVTSIESCPEGYSLSGLGQCATTRGCVFPNFEVRQVGGIPLPDGSANISYTCAEECNDGDNGAGVVRTGPSSCDHLFP